jgi:hypothetical protein
VETPSHFETAAVVSNGSRILFVNSSINKAFLPLSTRSLPVSSKDCVIEPLQAGNGDFTLNMGKSLRDRACNRRAKVRGRANGGEIYFEPPEGRDSSWKRVEGEAPYLSMVGKVCEEFAEFVSSVAIFAPLELLFKSFARRRFLLLCYHPSVGGSGQGRGPEAWSVTPIPAWACP